MENPLTHHREPTPTADTRDSGFRFHPESEPLICPSDRFVGQ